MRTGEWLLLSGGVAIAIGLLKTLGGSMTTITGQIVKVGQEVIFRLSLPVEARPYAEIFIQTGRSFGLDPFLLAAIAMRESRCGAALRSDGSGDCTARNPDVWRTAGPDGLPIDGACWGRGIMQIDYGLHREWIERHDWLNPTTNIRKGADLLREKLAFFASQSQIAGVTDGRYVTVSGYQASRRNVSDGWFADPRPLEGSALLHAGVAAYNTGERNVLQSIAVGLSPNFTTAGLPYGNRDYSTVVIANAIEMSQRFALS